MSKVSTLDIIIIYIELIFKGRISDWYISQREAPYNENKCSSCLNSLEPEEGGRKEVEKECERNEQTAAGWFFCWPSGNNNV